MNVIGVVTRWAKKVTGSAPSAVQSREEFEAWITPSTPHWDYLPIGPYRLIRTDMTSADVYAYEEHEDLTLAIVAFATRALPRVGEVCVLVDDLSQIVLGWFQEGENMRWGGCAHGFRLLTAVMQNDPTVVLWEADARAGHDRLTFRKTGVDGH